MLQTTDPHIITTQIDSLHTQVQIIDTTVTHVHVYDTIVTHVYDTIQPNLITVYEKLIASQDNNFDNILILIGIVVTILIVVVTAFNFLVAKKLFKIEFKKMLKAERKNIKKAALEDVERELNGLKAENSRTLALHLRNNGNKPIEFIWWAQCLYFSSKSTTKYLMSNAIRGILECLKACEENIPNFWESIESTETELFKIERNIKSIPNVSSEKREINNLFDKFKKELPESMKR